MANKLQRSDLFSLETYHGCRAEFRARVMAHKVTRKILLGENATLYFEDRLTLHYQVQEMLRVEKIFEAEAIEQELEVYNPLLPDGDNWKATFMLEYTDVDERRVALERLVGIENRVWMQVGDHPRVWAIADEDMERSTENKTSAVHFMRFQLTSEMIQSAQAGALLAAGIDHPAYQYTIDAVESATRESLLADLE